MNNPWTEISLPPKDVNARRINPEHPLDLFWAQDHLGHYLFIYEFSLEHDLPKFSIPNLVGIQTVYTTASGPTNKNRLILLLYEKNNWEIFLSLCSDLIQATWNTKNSTIAVQSILNRLEHWQEFLKNNRNDTLSEEKILGLIGELFFIKNHLIPSFGAGQSIKFWQGPDGLPQDFNVNESAIEVKCQSGSTSPYIKISSADQLCPQLPEMFLFVVRLGKATLGSTKEINLPKLVLEIREALRLEASNQVEKFNDHLYSLGYVDSDIYLDFNYVFASERMFQVTNDFPRICTHDLHRGIASVSYSISLLECTPFEKYPEWARAIK